MAQAWIGINQQPAAKLDTIAIIAVAFLKAACVVVPMIMIWGWLRWLKRPKASSVTARLSLVAFALATLSILLAIASLLYALAIGGFPYYDPRLLKIFRVGKILSLVGVIGAICGVWRPNSVRWHALVCSLGSLVFWLIAATGE